MRWIETRDGARMPVFGMGTWRMGENPTRRGAEVEALRLAFDLGVGLVDTAEMYAGGGAEQVVAEALQGRREDIFVVSKVLPQNASYKGTIAAAERSLANLASDYIDLYLLHWPSSHPLEGTLEAFMKLAEEGKIRRYGVSNFDLEDLQHALGLPGGERIGVNQVLYNLQRRGIERRLLPWSREQGLATMAYAPLEQGRLGDRAVLGELARRHATTPEQMALAWTLQREGVISIVKAAHPDHVRADVAALDLRLTEADLVELERAFPPPAVDIPLEVL